MIIRRTIKKTEQEKLSDLYGVDISKVKEVTYILDDLRADNCKGIHAAVALHYTDGRKSNKIYYCIMYELNGGGYTVISYFGKNNTSKKTKHVQCRGVSMSNAAALCRNIIAAKTHKQYVRIDGFDEFLSVLLFKKSGSTSNFLNNMRIIRS